MNILKHIIYLPWIVICLFACNRFEKKTEKSYPSNLPLINLQGKILKNDKKPISLFSSNEQIEYVQLENFPEGSYQDVLATKKHIYVILSHYRGLMVYTRNGEFLKHFDEPAFHLFKLFYDRYENRIFAHGWNNTWVLDDYTGEPLGDVQKLYGLPSHTVAYPLSSDRLFVLYGRGDEYNTKVGAAICDYEGKQMTDSLYIGKGDVELAPCWWSWSTFVTEDKAGEFLFFTFFRGAPYQTIFRVTPDKIEPVCYFDIEANIDMRYVWKWGDNLCFIYHFLCGGNILTETNVTLSVYNMKTGTLKSQRLLDKMNGKSSDKYLGVQNTIDGGLPIVFNNSSNPRHQVVDMILGKDANHYLQQNKNCDKIHSFIKEMREDSSPWVTIVKSNNY